MLFWEQCFSLENFRNIISQLCFLYFSFFVEFQQILLSEAGMGLLRGDVIWGQLSRTYLIAY